MDPNNTPACCAYCGADKIMIDVDAPVGIPREDVICCEIGEGK